MSYDDEMATAFSGLRAGERRNLALPDAHLRGELYLLSTLKPLRPASEIAAQIFSRYPRFVPTSVSLPELFITAEGEYAALISAVGKEEDATQALSLGIIFGDDCAYVIVGRPFEERQFDHFARLVRFLTYNEALGLGPRRRQFFYQPPLGWQPRLDGLITRYYPHDYPRTELVLSVHPAMPKDRTRDKEKNEDPESVFTALRSLYEQRGFKLSRVFGPDPVTSDFGLHGQSWCIAGSFSNQAMTRRDLLVLEDAYYLYALLFESGTQTVPPALGAVLSSVAHSLRPIPPPRRCDSESERPPFSHWSF